MLELARFRSCLPTCLYALAITAGLVDAQARVVPTNFDPLLQFCRRFSHQTAVIDNRLYIDGGYLQIKSLNPSDGPDASNYSNPNILYHDLSTTFRNGTDLGMPPLQANLKPKPANVPIVAGGALWADATNKKMYLYGGKFTNAQPVPFDLWVYDALYDSWDVVNQTGVATGNGNGNGNGFNVARIYNGASTVVERLGMGYYLGGWVGPDSQYGYEGDEFAVASLLSYDMVGNVWKNDTIPNGVPRAEGVMLYVPISDNGMLVAFGGVQVPGPDQTLNGTISRLSGLSTAPNITGIPMSEISLYDIASSKWYTQTATGEVPPSRRLFCAGVGTGNVRGPDGRMRQVHNIYLYGGAAAPDADPPGPGYDDVYVLSLPDFVWSKHWPSTNVNSNPHHSLSCNVIKNSQMLIIGGAFPLPQSQCDVADQAGTHNLNLSGTDPENTIWRAFSVNMTKYDVPNDIVESIRANETSTVRAYDHPDLTTLLARTPPTATRTPTRAVTTGGSRPSSGLSSRDRTIIIAVVVPVSVLIIAFAVFCAMRYRRHDRTDKMSTVDAPPPVMPPPAMVNEHDLYSNRTDAATTSAVFSETKLSPSAAAPEVTQVSQDTFSIRSGGNTPQPPQSGFGSPHILDASVPPTSQAPIAPAAPVAYIRNAVTGGLTPVYDEASANTANGGMSSPGRTVPSTRTTTFSEDLDPFSSAVSRIRTASEVHADSIVPPASPPIGNGRGPARTQSGLHELPGNY
ncbi:hypothetical protein TWF696_009449 [Orbilia brochopaga]|uniref:Mid2 domain-containing protein n=1 Tax=Orbilia brochopaga TaxID=3140254 RepID=A0AAV9UBE7_9PEZI